MSATNLTGEMSVLPGMIEVVVHIVASRVVADPDIIAMDVRSIGMAGLIHVRRMVIAMVSTPVRCRRLSDRAAPNGSRTMVGDVASPNVGRAALMGRGRCGLMAACGSAAFMAAALLGKCGDGADQHYGEKSCKPSHTLSSFCPGFLLPVQHKSDKGRKPEK